MGQSGSRSPKWILNASSAFVHPRNRAAGAGRRTAPAACLKKYGVTLPIARGGTGRSRFGASGASGASGRSGSTGARGRCFFGGGAFAGNPKFAAAFAKCGGGLGGRFGGTGCVGPSVGFKRRQRPGSR
jgi:hypothetical protein